MDTTTIYTKPGCPYCAAAMADMKERGIPFQEIDALGDKAVRSEMQRISGGLRVPTIVHPDGSVTVGFDGY